MKDFARDEMLPVIPAPGQVSRQDEGYFLISELTGIVAPDSLRGIAVFLQRNLHEESALFLNITNRGEQNAIEMILDATLKDVGDEGYVLVVEKTGIQIRAKTAAGVFSGIQTLRQLVPAADKRQGKPAEIACMKICDSPRFPWRGFMLDVARHYFCVNTIKQLLDAMALLKMNILHLHLCDDQGWRIEIDKYPRLVAVGSTRPETQIGGFLGRKTDRTPHSGYYTKQEIRELIAYAAERFITVVPEIEMPGHCTAALAAYPELGCTGGPYNVATFSGIKKDIYCPGREATFSFLQDVLDEVIELFPSPWIHIGGDEAPKARWKACSDCQSRIKAEKLRDEEELQAYFVNRMASYIEQQGRVVIGWNEILSDRLPSSVIGQHWIRNQKKVLRHLRKGGKIIGSHFFHVYLDYNHGVLPLSKVYAYNPVPARLEKQFRENILGIEAPFWSEFAATSEHMYAFVFPRLIAVAENAWTTLDKGRDFRGFVSRLPVFLERLRFRGIAHTTIAATQPGPLKRLPMWMKILKQTSEVPEIVRGGSRSSSRCKKQDTRCKKQDTRGKS